MCQYYYIIAITNRNVDNASPRNKPLRIFTSANLFPPAVYSPVFHGFLV